VEGAEGADGEGLKEGTLSRVGDDEIFVFVAAAQFGAVSFKVFVGKR
jgi:hypothetical protein